MTDLEPQRRAFHEGVLLQRAPELGAIVVTGKDRTSWLNGLLTCDLAPLREGQGAYGLSVLKSGKILTEVRVVLAPSRVVLGALRDRIPSLLSHLDKYLIMEDAEARDASGEIGWILAHGPHAHQFIDTAREAGAEAAAMDMTGLGGAAIAVPIPEGNTDAVFAVERALLARAGAHGAVVSPESWESLRVEIGLPVFRTDYDEQNYPQEASLERLAVSFQKGCYLGQEAVFMLQMRGHVKKRLVPIRVEGTADVLPGTEIALSDGTPVGSITSRAPGPEGTDTVALGYVKYKHASSGTALSIEGRPARVVGVSDESDQGKISRSP
jgi:hypothetical protein